MAETQSKRQREETHIEDCEETKRHKSYTQILSFLEDEEEEPTQDLSDIFTTLQQELSRDFDPLPGPTQEADLDHPTAEISAALKEEDDDKEKVIRHLLEASDDELGIPHRVDGGDEGINGGDQLLSLCDGLWEFEDEAANYYSLLQSELFL